MRDAELSSRLGPSGCGTNRGRVLLSPAAGRARFVVGVLLAAPVDRRSTFVVWLTADGGCDAPRQWRGKRRPYDDLRQSPIVVVGLDDCGAARHRAQRERRPYGLCGAAPSSTNAKEGRSPVTGQTEIDAMGETTDDDRSA